MTTDIQNLKSFDPFAEAEDAGGEIKVGNQQNYIHIRIQRWSPSPLPCPAHVTIR
jgi:translation initiation factor 1